MNRPGRVWVLVWALLIAGCVSRSPGVQPEFNGGIQTSQQMEFNQLILEQRKQIGMLREEVLLHRRQISQLMQQLQSR